MRVRVYIKQELPGRMGAERMRLAFKESFENTEILRFLSAHSRPKMKLQAGL
jgi:hypothetical protein